MYSENIPYKSKADEELIIDGNTILPNEPNLIRINAGKLPSDNRINVHAHIFTTGKPGPSILILGGVHGNEINGVEIVRRSIEENIFNNIVRGTVIVIPLLNVYGFINFSRDVADGKDVNRSFPGNINGSLASRVARIITKKILPHVDIALDFHTGGDARYNYPQVRYNKLDPNAVFLARIMGLKYMIEQPMIANSFRKACHEVKIPAVVYEGGESIRLDKLSIESGIIAIKNVLSAVRIADFSPQIVPETWIIHRETWIRSTTPGIFIWTKKSGDFVKKGELLGHIKDAYGTKSTDVISTFEGHIIGHNNASVVSLGEALFHIGIEYTKLGDESSKNGGF